MMMVRSDTEKSAQLKHFFMETRQNNLFKKGFAIAFFFSIIGALIKINHLDYADTFLYIGVISTFTYIGIGIYEVNKSTKIKSSEKIFWTIGFILFSFFVGVYYFMNRNKIV